jgi:hypothetical protein
VVSWFIVFLRNNINWLVARTQSATTQKLQVRGTTVRKSSGAAQERLRRNSGESGKKSGDDKHHIRVACLFVAIQRG